MKIPYIQSLKSAYIQVSRNNNDDLSQSQLKGFFHYLRSVNYPYIIEWQSKIRCMVIVKIPNNFVESFHDIAKQHIPFFTVKQITNQEYEFLTDNTPYNRKDDEHRCNLMYDALNDMEDVFNIHIFEDLGGWLLQIDMRDSDDAFVIPILFCPYCGEKLPD